MFKGKIQTVSGLIEPDSLGVTLCHEHLSIRCDKEGMHFPPQGKNAHLAKAPFTIENLGWIRQNPYSNTDNLQLKNIENELKADLRKFKQFGGRTIVENSTYGLERDILLVKQLADETGVNVVAGTGYYVGPFQTESTKQQKEEDLSRQISQDLLEGVADSGIKCGVIGEIGCCWPLFDFEKRSLRASASVQSQLQCPVIIHPGRHPDSPDEIVRVFQEAGGDIRKTIMSHMDRTIMIKEDIAEFAKTGCMIEYDLFGIEVSYYQMSPEIDMPNDAERINRIRYLVEEGFSDQLVIAHDIHTKHRLTAFGGHGYSHILENVVPQMLVKGVSQEAIDKMLIHNPQRWLTI